MWSRCVKCGYRSHSLILVSGSSTWHLMVKNSLRIWKKELLLLYIKMALAIRRLPRPWNWAAARWPRPYSVLTGHVPLRTGLTMVHQRSWVHVLSVISRGCVWEIDVWVLPALLQRLKGWGGQPVSAQTICRTLNQIGLHGCRPGRKPLLKMMHKKARTGKLQFIEGTMNANMYCDILKQSMIPSIRRLGCRAAVFPHDNDHCLAKEAEGKGDGLAKHVSRPKPYWASVGHPQTEGWGGQGL